MTNDMTEPRAAGEPLRPADRWAVFRFATVGPLLAAPPASGKLREAILALAAKAWRHPIRGEDTRFSFATIERWYYLARNERCDPVAQLRRRVRRDAGQQNAITVDQAEVLRAQHRDHPGWSYQLHYDNLRAVVVGKPDTDPLPSYSTVRRWLQRAGLFRQSKRRHGEVAAEPREPREVRSYEAEYVHGLWHADFHHGSRQVLTRAGKWQKPLLFAVMDDRTRLCCHAQWYLDESAESFVHGLCQAIQKRGLPRAMMTDNGAAMCAIETLRGLQDLGIVPQRTLPYSPHQNAKQEVFWAQVEGRLMAMLEGVSDLTLTMINDATQAWVEGDYNQRFHSEIGTSPLRRFLDDKSVGRDSPSSEDLRRAFRAEWRRAQRRSDGTISLLGRRFEIPARYLSLPQVHVRCARWDFGFVDLVDEHTGQVLCPIYPLDKQKNAEGVRRSRALIEAPVPPTPRASGIAPLLRQLMADYSATGLPPGYLPKDGSDANTATNGDTP
jgi:transposase InsO family protein